MSQKFPGGFITKSPVAPTTTAASGIWTLDQQEQYQQAGTWPSPPPPPYIEDVFSTYLYKGTSGANNVVNGIDLSTKGGLVWIKTRDVGASHYFQDTARGANNFISSNNTSAETNLSALNTVFNTNGFSQNNNYGGFNDATYNYASWTFRKQAKFFDVVTWTGDGVAGRQISHSLGSAPGAIIVKCTSVARDWAVWQNTLTDGTYLKLNTTDSVITNTSFQVFGDASGQTSTYFTVGKSGSGVNGLTNANGDTYVAYIFADDAGGFGATETENVISCGSFTSNGSGLATINLGYEPQWVMVKGSSAVTNWQIVDNMRGFVAGAGSASSKYLNANSSAAEMDTPPYGLTSTGFEYNSAPSTTFIYIAIRRGPMKTPTDATKVFTPAIVTESTTGPNYTNTITSNFPVDWVFTTTSDTSRRWGTRLIGNAVMSTNSTSAETNFGLQSTVFDSNISAGIIGTLGSTASAYMYAFKRAPSFFDEVCYTGDGTTNRAISHNLGVVPELIINRPRNYADNWEVYQKDVGLNSYFYLNSTAAPGSNTGNWSTMTSSVFGTGYAYSHNSTARTYVSYLFATCAGISKVGSYTGTGALQTINCGFTSGARFVLIKRTDSTGDWYTYDSARGITSGNDPYLFLNSTAAEVTGTNYVDTDTTGFKVTAAAPAGLNASGGTYIFLAIA
jgi:hypothetical protein